MAGVAKIPQDWSELLELLKEVGADFLVVGAYALAAHGHERYTKNLDLWLAADAQTAAKVALVLSRFGFPEPAPTVEEWVNEKTLVQLGREPYRVDLLNFASGIEFSDAFANRVVGRLADVEVACLSRESLIANKLASGRMQDLADIEAIAPERSADVRNALKKKLLESD